VEVAALRGVNFRVQPGEFVSVMGPSGCGKSSLLYVLGGLAQASRGRVLVDGNDLAAMTDAERTKLRRQKIGFVFQRFNLLPTLDARGNIAIAQHIHGNGFDPHRFQVITGLLGLGDRLKHRPSEMSGGEQQRVAIARALINQPKLILADEPTGNLDEANEEIVIGLFRELHSAGHTILMVTHDPDIAQQADRRIELVHGHLAVDQRVTMDDGIHFDHLLEQIWVCGEEGRPSDLEHIRTPGGVDPVRTLARMEDLHLVKVLEEDQQVELTDRGKSRARDVVRRHRLAERLFKDTFRIDEHEAHTQACKFEHIISPELDEKICSFLGHPTTCPHGNPIPPGSCCNHKKGTS
jgi:putative ABC transport system ATP-binding protein